MASGLLDKTKDWKMNKQYKHTTENEATLYFGSYEAVEEYKIEHPEAYEDGELDELETDNVRIIFDNAGGTILQFNGWAHSYNGCEKQIAQDLYNWINEGTTDGWEGHEIEALDIDVDAPYGYEWLNITHDTLRELIADLIKIDGCNDALIKALASHL